MYKHTNLIKIIQMICEQLLFRVCWRLVWHVVLFLLNRKGHYDLYAIRYTAWFIINVYETTYMKHIRWDVIPFTYNLVINYEWLCLIKCSRFVSLRYSILLSIISDVPLWGGTETRIFPVTNAFSWKSP